MSKFGHPATVPGAAPLHLAVQLEKVEAVKLLLQHKVLWTRWLDLPSSEGYSKTVLTATVCFFAISSDGWLDQNAKWGAEMMRLPHWTPSNHRVLEDFGEASESPWLFVLHKGGVRILLHEADPNLETEQGQRPLSLVKASYSGHELSRRGCMFLFVSGECYIFLYIFGGIPPTMRFSILPRWVPEL